MVLREKPVRLLAIDDEVEFIHLISCYFKTRGYEVLVAHRGDVGLAVAKREKPDVCLIDLKMPGMHGDEVMKEILLDRPETKCIMITASEGTGRVRDHLKNMGAYACFDKPLTSLKDLEKAIEDALSDA